MPAYLYDLGASASSSGHRPIGVFHQLRANNMKATCRMHKNCVLWLTLRGQSAEEAEDDLAKWVSLASAAGGGISEDAHWQAAQVLKRSYGMVLRPPRR